MLKAILAAVALGVIVGQATLDLVFPEQVVTQGYDPATWRPCPDRKPTKWNKRRAVWYCGPSDEPGTPASPSVMAASAAPRSTSSRPAGGRGAAQGGR